MQPPDAELIPRDDPDIGNEWNDYGASLKWCNYGGQTYVWGDGETGSFDYNGFYPHYYALYELTGGDDDAWERWEENDALLQQEVTAGWIQVTPEGEYQIDVIGGEGKSDEEIRAMLKSPDAKIEREGKFNAGQPGGF